QPAIFAVQVALAELWRTWGITPDVVVGQSLGEVAAAYCAGALSLDDAIRVVVHRSRLMQRVAGHGRTAVVGLPPEKAQLTLTGLEDSVAVAGNNSPDLSVLAGDPTMLERILGSLERQGIFCRLVRGVDIAFHSPQMDPLVGELVQALDGLQPSTPTIPLYSTVNGTLVEDASLDATYWGRNLREPFSFASVVTELAEQGYDTFLEVSPHPVLTSAITETLQHHKCAGSVIPSLRRDAAQQTILTSFGKLYVAGHTVDWQQLYPQGICIELPTYPWQRQRYWFDQLDSVGHAMGQAQKHADTHPLLGEHLYASIAPHRHFWEMDVNDYTVHYMRDHRVNDAVVWPAAAYLEMALAAMSRTFDTSDHVLCDMHFKQALFLSSEQLRRVQVVVTPEGPEQAAFAVHSVNAPVQTGDAWVQHAYGHAKRIVESPSIQPIDNPDAIRTRCTDEMDGATHYQNMQMRGLHYGATFRAIERIWRRDGEALGLLQLPAALEGEAAVYSIHPALLDSSFQMVAATLSGGETTTEETFLPVSVACVQVHQRPTGSVWCHAVLTSDTSSESRTADISLFDESNKLIAEISGLRLQRIDGAQQADDSDVRRSLYELRWIRSTEEAVQAEAALQGRWLIFTDQTGIGTGLANALREQGAEPVMINRAATYGSNGPDSYTVNPTQPDELQQLMSDIAANGAPPQGIMYLWALDLPATDTLQINDFDELELVSCEAVMHLVQ
ncbi:MAG: acyltransferase domain-containing protein, partial [Chloroflexota bacterium]